ncbi:hemagglutinin/amebocyte aggregation factor-like [Montipora foliosa]|uniref:hemagglutinin/amebocyte aggregation factor-like n=1 Tax=Montipora foliosa TaxID=591990 RepID=UPI0035F14D06
MDETFIFHVTSCSDWKPSWASWNNDWDGPVDFDCGKGYSISRIRSYHDNCKEDRLWSFSCQSNAAAEHCSWSSHVNAYDEALYYTCPHNGFITGVHSHHSNQREDRRFQFRCCHKHNYQRYDCRWTFRTYYDETIDYSTYHGYYLAGVRSYHNNYYEDRRWKFLSCRLI